VFGNVIVLTKLAVGMGVGLALLLYRVGGNVPWAVGAAEGTGVGLLVVGRGVGKGEGRAVGRGVGFLEGITVGLGVGKGNENEAGSSKTASRQHPKIEIPACWRRPFPRPPRHISFF